MGTTWIKRALFDIDGHALLKASTPATPLATWQGFTTFDVEDYLAHVEAAGNRVGHVSSTSADQTGLPAGLPLFIGGGDLPCAALALGRHG